jgi:pyruvate dehydrogenase (quinone)
VDLCAKVHDAKLGREKSMHMAKRVADLLVEVLLEAGVQRMYGVSGDSLNGITDAIRQRAHMRWIHVRHEEAATATAAACLS